MASLLKMFSFNFGFYGASCVASYCLVLKVILLRLIEIGLQSEFFVSITHFKLTPLKPSNLARHSYDTIQNSLLKLL